MPQTKEQPAEPIQAGGVDWDRNWHDVVETRRIAVEALASQGAQRDYWDRRGDRFARMSREFKIEDDPLGRQLLAEARPGDSLLDVGAGAGRYSAGLAPLIRGVTAVEPSGGMRTHLAAELARRAIGNVVVVPRTWEEATVEPHDIVLASHVLYPIADVVPFVRKLDAATRRACFITIRVNDMVPQLNTLWRAVWGQERPREPGFLDLYNLLFALGIRPNVRLVPFGSGLGFHSMDEALEYVRRLLFVPDDLHKDDDRIRTFLDGVLVNEGSRLALPNQTQAAIVWWTKAD